MGNCPALLSLGWGAPFQGVMGCPNLHIGMVTTLELLARLHLGCLPDSTCQGKLWRQEAGEVSSQHQHCRKQSLAIKVLLAPKVFANYCCALLLSCPFLSLCSFPLAFDSMHQSLVPNLVKFQLPCYSLSALWEMTVWKCV